MVKEGETQGKEEGAVAASSFAVAVGPWVAGERAKTEEEGGDRKREGKRTEGSRGRERSGNEGDDDDDVFIYIYYFFLI